MADDIFFSEPLEGYLEMEDPNANAFRRRFFRLNRGNNVLEYYREKPEDSEDAEKTKRIGVIEIQYITNVAVSSQRQKKDNCFEISTTGKKYYIAAPTPTEMQHWISTLHKAAVNPKKSSRNNSESRSEQRSESESSSENITYQTQIVGGVVIKCPVQKVDNDSEPPVPIGERTGSGLRLIKDGWCFKQGAVMKNWKRRYFTLNVLKLCYFGSKEECHPLKTILMQEVRGVRDVSGYSSRDNVFEVDTPHRKFYVQTDTKDDLKSWMSEIRKIITPPS